MVEKFGNKGAKKNNFNKQMGFRKNSNHMYAYAFKIFQKICSKIAHFSNQSKFPKKSIEKQLLSSVLHKGRTLFKTSLDNKNILKHELF